MSLYVDAAFENQRRKVEGIQTTSETGSLARSAGNQTNIEIRTDGQVVKIERSLDQDSRLEGKKPAADGGHGAPQVILSCQGTIQ